MGKSEKMTNNQLLMEIDQLKAKVSKMEKSDGMRKKAEESLKDSEERFRFVAENLIEGLWITDKKDKMIYFNRSMEGISGANSKDVLGLDLLKDFPTETIQYFKNYYLKAKKTLKSTPYEADVVTPDGRITVQKGWLIPRSIDNVFDGMVCTVEDISELKKAEQAYRDSEKRYKTLGETSHEGILLCDLEGTYQFCNKQHASILGYDDPKELIGRNGFDFIAKEDQEKAQKSLQRIFENGHAENTIINVVRKDGQKRITEHTTEVLKDEEGNPTGIMSLMCDITEEKRIETELIKSAERFERWKSSNFIGIIHSNDKGEIIDANKTLLNTIGYTKKEMKEGKLDWTKLTPPEFLHLDQKAMKEAMAKGTWAPFEKEYIHKDGHRVPVLIGGSVFKETPDEYIVFIIDLTESKLTEEKLKAAEKKSEVWLENSPVCTKIVDLDFNLQYMSSIGVRELKIDDITEYYGKPYPLDFYPDSFKIPMRRNLKKAGETGKTITQEAPIVDVDGNELWYHSTIVPVNDDKGKLAYFMVVSLETTERKRAEEALKISSFATETSLSAIFASDIKGSITYANKTAAKMWGHKSAAEMIGTDVLGYWTKSSQGKATEMIETLLKDGFVVSSGDLIGKRVDGTEFIVESNSILVKDENGDPSGMIGSFSDITKRKQAEIELIKAKDKAEESDRLKSAFLANMSHEIRTPMNSILGFMSLLKEPDIKHAEKEAYIQIVNESGDRLLHTINDIIEISKIESGDTQLSKQKVDIPDLLAYYERLFLPDVTSKGLQFDLQKPKETEGIIIYSDRNKLDSIMSNLIYNAIKFTQKGTIEFGCQIHEDEILFFVKDTGIGIEKKQISKIFNRFSQSDLDKQMDVEGSGLGLAICKSYVEILGGKIWVKSKVNQGTSFYFTIPRDKGKEWKHSKDQLKAEVKKTKIGNTNEKKLCILIAEDHEPSAMLLEQLLKHVDCEVLRSRTGTETVELCQNNPNIDIILMDIKLPDINGYEATQKIREFNKEVFIIAQTAYALAGDKKKAKVAGCNKYMSKPVNRDILLKMISDYVSST